MREDMLGILLNGQAATRMVGQTAERFLPQAAHQGVAHYCHQECDGQRYDDARHLDGLESARQEQPASDCALQNAP
ncbi:hypothetical protein FQZ97_1073100 [compost metagenome]